MLFLSRCRSPIIREVDAKRRSFITESFHGKQASGVIGRFRPSGELIPSVETCGCPRRTQPRTCISHQPYSRAFHRKRSPHSALFARPGSRISSCRSGSFHYIVLDFPLRAESRRVLQPACAGFDTEPDLLHSLELLFLRRRDLAVTSMGAYNSAPGFLLSRIVGIAPGDRNGPVRSKPGNFQLVLCIWLPNQERSARCGNLRAGTCFAGPLIALCGDDGTLLRENTGLADRD